MRGLTAYPCNLLKHPITVPVLCLPMEQLTSIGKLRTSISCYIVPKSPNQPSPLPQSVFRRLRTLTCTASITQSRVKGSHGLFPSCSPRWWIVKSLSSAKASRLSLGSSTARRLNPPHFLVSFKCFSLWDGSECGCIPSQTIVLRPSSRKNSRLIADGWPERYRPFSTGAKLIGGISLLKPVGIGILGSLLLRVYGK